jgi:molecular chaperone DnaK
MTTDPNPLLVVRALEPDAVGSLRVVRQDGGFASPWLPLNAKGGAAVELEVQPGRVNGFALEARDRAGAAARCAPSEFTVMHGFSVARPPLSQSVGVLRADGTMCWYLRKGAVLPARQKMKHATTSPLARRQSGDAIHVPILQGEHAQAARNKVVGVLRIRAEAITRDLPAGSEVEVTLTIDESSHTAARAYVPVLDQWFDEVALLELESKSADEVKRELDAQAARLAELERMAEALDADAAPRDPKAPPAAGPKDERVAEIQSLIEEGDRDAVDVADQLLRAMSSEVDAAFEQGRGADLRARFEDEWQFGGRVTQASGTADEKRLYGALGTEFNREFGRGDFEAAEARLRDLYDLVGRVLVRIPEFWEATYDDLVHRFAAAPNPAATALLADGLAARRRRDIPALTQACIKLFALLPKEQQKGLEALKVVSHVR